MRKRIKRIIIIAIITVFIVSGLAFLFIPHAPNKAKVSGIGYFLDTTTQQTSFRSGNTTLYVKYYLGGKPIIARDISVANENHLTLDFGSFVITWITSKTAPVSAFWIYAPQDVEGLQVLITSNRHLNLKEQGHMILMGRFFLDYSDSVKYLESVKMENGTIFLNYGKIPAGTLIDPTLGTITGNATPLTVLVNEQGQIGEATYTSTHGTNTATNISVEFTVTSSVYVTQIKILGYVPTQYFIAGTTYASVWCSAGGLYHYYYSSALSTYTWDLITDLGAKTYKAYFPSAVTASGLYSFSNAILTIPIDTVLEPGTYYLILELNYNPIYFEGYNLTTTAPFSPVSGVTAFYLAEVSEVDFTTNTTASLYGSYSVTAGYNATYNWNGTASPSYTPTSLDIYLPKGYTMDYVNITNTTAYDNITSFTYTSYNTTYNEITITLSLTGNLTINAGGHTTNAIYSVSCPPTIGEGQTLPISIELKDALGDLLNQTVNITIFNSSNASVFEYIGNSTNGWLNVSLTPNIPPGDYIIQVSTLGAWVGILDVSLKVIAQPVVNITGISIGGKNATFSVSWNGTGITKVYVNVTGVENFTVLNNSYNQSIYTPTEISIKENIPITFPDPGNYTINITAINIVGQTVSSILNYEAVLPRVTLYNITPTKVYVEEPVILYLNASIYTAGNTTAMVEILAPNGSVTYATGEYNVTSQFNWSTSFEAKIIGDYYVHLILDNGFLSVLNISLEATGLPPEIYNLTVSPTYGIFGKDINLTINASYLAGLPDAQISLYVYDGLGGTYWNGTIYANDTNFLKTVWWNVSIPSITIYANANMQVTLVVSSPLGTVSKNAFVDVKVLPPEITGVSASTSQVILGTTRAMTIWITYVPKYTSGTISVSLLSPEGKIIANTTAPFTYSLNVIFTSHELEVNLGNLTFTREGQYYIITNLTTPGGSYIYKLMFYVSSGSGGGGAYVPPQTQIIQHAQNNTTQAQSTEQQTLPQGATYGLLVILALAVSGFAGGMIYSTLRRGQGRRG